MTQPIIDTQSANPDDLAVAWVGEVLEESDLSAQDNFLDLGGHSVLALELSERAKKNLGVDLDMQILFERSIGEALADAVARARTTK
ncbi:phosphopantetheine-binding protein [Streptomyces sp. NBRC 110028]|uniref:phosphopantetheine-binding protein n=1 Tax=Streptomyces sp. NBRC 110028 TaxID=1621260 RepID=UPI0006E406D2|nr:phosphopantetheine-binding protein [Streptomyces sp. NBRC 110028]